MDPDEDSQPDEELIGLSGDGEAGATGSDSRVSAASDVLSRVTSSATGVSIPSEYFVASAFPPPRDALRWTRRSLGEGG